MAESTVVNKKRASFRIRVEPRLNEPPAWYPAAVSFGALIVALMLGGVLISFAGGDPIGVPTSASGPACFAGKVSFDGLDQPIGGDTCVYGPIPAVSEWGALVLGISLLIAGTLLLHRRVCNSAIL